MSKKFSTIEPSHRPILIHGLISLVVICLTIILSNMETRKPFVSMVRAAEIMDSSLRYISEHTHQKNLNTDLTNDPRSTGLIGPELSSITTTTGDIAAKRTTMNPDFAALIVYLLVEAGIEPGDTVAIGCSGSFPALMIASMAATRALKLEARVILSLGSSSWGASNPQFNLWHIWQLLRDHGLIMGNPVAISLGGEQDTGSGFEGDIATRLESEILASGLPLISQPDLAKNIRCRDSLYFNGKPRSVRAFISTGGSYANLGTGAEILTVRPGLVRRASMPRPDQQGMIHSMLRKKIPVIHLLYIKGLARKYNLPWDPASQPESDLRFYAQQQSGIWILPSCVFLIYFFAFLLLQNRHKKRAG